MAENVLHKARCDLSEQTNVCFVIPSLQAGGMERVMSELIWYFSKKEITIDLVLYGKKKRHLLRYS